VEAGLQAGVGVRLHHVTAVDLIGTDAAVVAALRGREAAEGEAVGAAVLEEGVLLLDAEDRLLIGVLGGDLGALAPGVGLVGLHRDVQHLGHHEDVVAPADRVRAGEHGLEHAVRLVARGLVGRRAVEAPDRELLDAVVQDLGLRAQLRRRLGAVDPDVLRLVRHCGFLSSTIGGCQGMGRSSRIPGSLTQAASGQFLDRSMTVNAM
jgi:hypothetical protein